MAAEVQRRLVHASGTGLPALYLLDLTDWPTVVGLLVLGAVVALALEALRLFVGLDWAIYDRLTREYEQNNLAGYALYFVSSAGVAVVTLYALPDPHRIAIPAVLMLTVGDPVSGLLGSGELQPMKQARVLVVMFTVCTALAVPFAQTAALARVPPDVAWLVWPVAAVGGAAAATAADGLKPVVAGYVVDDNLTIPPAAAVGMWVPLSIGAALV